MRKVTFLMALFGMALGMPYAAGQTINPPPKVKPDLPYGGAYVAPGSFGPGPFVPGAPDTSSACPGNDLCVLTGQYNQHRTSTNAKASKLATLSDFSNFGAAYIYQVTHTAAGRASEPVTGQPLYITGVTVSNALSGSSACNGNLASCNMLLVGTLNDYIYAFDTSSPPGSAPRH